MNWLFNHTKANKLEQQLHTATSIVMSKNSETNELRDLVVLANRLSTLPRQSVPVPKRTHAFALIEESAHVATGLKLLRLSSYIAGATLVVGLALTTSLATGSKPGNALYTYKLASERLRLRLTSDPGSKLDLQIRYVENRIKDTESALNNPHIDTATKVAALTELANQTKATVEAVKQEAVKQKNTTLLDKLATLTQSQVTVINKATDTATQKLAEGALATAEESTKTIAEAKQIVAASNESALAALPTNAITIKGAIESNSNSTVTVGSNVITITQQTEYKNTTGDAKPNLKVGTSVSIIALKTNGILTAQTITILPTAGKVKGTTDLKNDDILDTKLQKPNEQDNTPNEATQAQTGFQIESPAPQYDNP